MREICAAIGCRHLQASYDKANRSSGASFRGPAGARPADLASEKEIGSRAHDVHESEQCGGRPAVDVLQKTEFSAATD